VKEPSFFADERIWMRGLDWYRGLFEDATADQLTGEASVIYTDPSRAVVAASRIAHALPDVKLLFLVRDPIERIRSHYRHEVLRGRERRSLREALTDPGSAYATRSLYFTCLHPYLVRFPKEQVCIVRSEKLFGADDDTWDGILAFLGLAPRPRPSTHLNASSGRDQFGPAMTVMWEAGLRRSPRWMPTSVRRALRPLLIRRRSSPLLETAAEPVPDSVALKVQEDLARLERWMEEDAAASPPMVGHRAGRSLG
jgi:hypothetical protein